MKTIAERIKKSRLNLGINQKELAKRANITEGSLSRYENDIREPKSSALTRLSNALNVSTDYLLGFETNNTQHNCDIILKDNTDLLDILQSVEQHLKLNKENLTICKKSASKEAVDGVLYSIKAAILLSTNDL